MGRTVAEVSEKTLKIQAYLEEQEPGTEISYAKIAHDTGVVMDEHGKNYLRSALHRAKLEYTVRINYGIVLADKENAMGIVTHKLKKIDKAVRRGERSHHNIQEQFFESLSQEKQKEILYLGAVFGAIRVATENGRLIYRGGGKGSTSNLRIPPPTP